MILETPCALCSSSSTRSRNGRVPDFELLSRPTTRPSSVGTRLASGTAFPALTAAGTSNSMVAMPVAPSLSTNLVRVDHPSIHHLLWGCPGILNTQPRDRERPCRGPSARGEPPKNAPRESLLVARDDLPKKGSCQVARPHSPTPPSSRREGTEFRS